MAILSQTYWQISYNALLLETKLTFSSNPNNNDHEQPYFLFNSVLPRTE